MDVPPIGPGHDRMDRDVAGSVRLAGIAGVSRYLPTRAYADALVAAALGLGVAWRSWLVLAGFTAVFGLAAVAGYRRDEGRRFS